MALKGDDLRLVVGLVLVFLLGIVFAVVNGIYTSSSGTPLPLIAYAMSFISVIIGAVLVWLFRGRIERGQTDKMLNLLPAEEGKLVRLLLNNSGSLEQNKLVALSGFDKVKVSRIVSVLEQRGAVKKTNLGNTNLIVLKI